MLQRVEVGQSRFNVPGLAVDGRGAALGRQWLVRFGAMDRLVSFLRIWSAEQVLDDVQPGLRMVQVRRESGSREVLLAFPVASAALADAAARAARLAGGDCFTGAGKQFVQYRDGRAPFGYDVAALEPSSGADYVLYASEQTIRHFIVGELPLEQLLLRLELQRDVTAVAMNAVAAASSLYLRVRRGLGPVVLEYLYRAQRLNPGLVAAASLCDQDATGRFDRATRFWLFRLAGLSLRLRTVLSQTPGMTLLAPVAENIAVAVGYRHPIHLGGCRGLFRSDRLFLFAPPPQGVTSLSPLPAMVAIADLARLEGGGAMSLPHGAPVVPGAVGHPVPVADAVAGAPAAEPKEWVVPIRLEVAPAGHERIVATLIPWDQAGWLRSLCYALPPSALQRHRAAILERGILIVAPDTLVGFPFGRLFHAPAPGLLVPLGWNVRPAIPPQLLAARMGAADGAWIVFAAPAEPPFRVPADAMQPLEARVLSDPRLRQVFIDAGILSGTAAGDAPATDTDIEIQNQAIGLLPLWRLGKAGDPG